MRSGALTIACAVLLLATSSPAAPTTGQAVLEQNCSSCHAIASPKGGLDLRTREPVARRQARPGADPGPVGKKPHHPGRGRRRRVEDASRQEAADRSGGG